MAEYNGLGETMVICIVAANTWGRSRKRGPKKVWRERTFAGILLHHSRFLKRLIV